MTHKEDVKEWPYGNVKKRQHAPKMCFDPKNAAECWRTRVETIEQKTDIFATLAVSWAWSWDHEVLNLLLDSVTHIGGVASVGVVDSWLLLLRNHEVLLVWWVVVPDLLGRYLSHHGMCWSGGVGWDWCADWGQRRVDVGRLMGLWLLAVVEVWLAWGAGSWTARRKSTRAVLKGLCSCEELMRSGCRADNAKLVVWCWGKVLNLIVISLLTARNDTGWRNSAVELVIWVVWALWGWWRVHHWSDLKGVIASGGKAGVATGDWATHLHWALRCHWLPLHVVVHNICVERWVRLASLQLSSPLNTVRILARAADLLISLWHIVITVIWLSGLVCSSCVFSESGLSAKAVRRLSNPGSKDTPKGWVERGYRTFYGNSHMCSSKGAFQCGFFGDGQDLKTAGSISKKLLA